MTPFTYDVLGIICGLLPAPMFLVWRLWPRPRVEAPEPVHGAIAVIAYRYCPDEHRVRAAIVHGDGTAACLDCGTTTPATEVPRA